MIFCDGSDAMVTCYSKNVEPWKVKDCWLDEGGRLIDEGNFKTFLMIYGATKIPVDVGRRITGRVKKGRVSGSSIWVARARQLFSVATASVLADHLMFTRGVPEEKLLVWVSE